MADSKFEASDADLLARFNALKKSTIDLNNTAPSGHSFHNPATSQTTAIQPAPLHALAAQDLRSDLVSRFKFLSGQDRPATSTPSNSALSPQALPDTYSDDSVDVDQDKTVEELLAEISGQGIDNAELGSWQVTKSEEDEVDDLLRSARDALRNSEKEDETGNGDFGLDKLDRHDKQSMSQLPKIDMSVFQAGDEIDTDNPSDDETEKARPISEKSSTVDTEKVRPTIKDSVDREADEVLQRIMDEIALNPTTPFEVEEDTNRNKKDDTPEDISRSSSPDSRGDSRSKRAITSQGPSSTTKSPQSHPPLNHKPIVPEESDLSSRFAQLTLPSHLPSSPTTTINPKPTTKSNSNISNPSPLPSVPTTLKATPQSTRSNPRAPTSLFPNQRNTHGHIDEEIDTWCVICLTDATVRCLGCDGDLYCGNCWTEGHRGPDAGYEEKRHRAVQFTKGGGRGKKQETRRVMLGA